MSLQEIFVDELRDLYSAENQLVKAQGKVARNTANAEMKSLLRDQHEQAKSQVLRLREVFQHVGKKATGQHCSGMEGCLKEVAEALEEEKGALKDTAILGAMLRVKHYEIAGYSAALAITKALKEREIASLLTETLNEEREAVKNLLSEAKAVLKDAATQVEEDEEEEEEPEQDPEEEESARKSEEDESGAEPELQGATKGKRGKKTTE